MYLLGSSQGPIVNILGWIFVVVGLALMVGLLADAVFGHYGGMVGLLLLFTGVSILKKRKDQLRNQRNKAKSEES